MDIDKIIEKMRKEQFEDFLSCYVDVGNGQKNCINISKAEKLISYMNGAEDVVKLIKQQTPPCTGSSVQRKDKIDKLKHDFKKVTEPSTVTTIDANGNVTLEFNKMMENYHRVPITNEQLMDKINEIVDVINKL